MKLPSQAVRNSTSNTNARRIGRHLHDWGQEWSLPGFRHRQGRISALVRLVAVTFPTGGRRSIMVSWSRWSPANARYRERARIRGARQEEADRLHQDHRPASTL